MAGEYGLGIGSFLDGLAKGSRTMSELQERAEQTKELKYQRGLRDSVRDMSKQGYEDAKATRSAEVAGKIKKQEGIGGLPDKYLVGEQSYDQESEAQKAAEKSVKSVTNFYMQNTAPKIQEYYLANGEQEKADAYAKWIQTDGVQQGMKHMAGAMRSAYMGDDEGFLKNVVAAYNLPGYIDDGVEAVGSRILRDKEGNASGIEITTRDSATGKEITQQFDGMNDVLTLAQQFGSPEQVFERGYADQKTAQKIRAESALKQQRWDQDIQKLGISAQLNRSNETHKSQLNRSNEAYKSQLRREEKSQTGNASGNKKAQDLEAKIDLLKKYHYNDDQIRDWLPRMMNITAQQKNPKEAMAQTLKFLAESDPRFARLPDDQKLKRANAFLQLQEETIEQSSESNAGKGSRNTGAGLPSGAVSFGGAPAPAQTPPIGMGLYHVYDTKTGKVVAGG